MNEPGFLDKRLFLLHGRALYVGMAFDTDLHAHHALQICVCLRGSLDLHSGENPNDRLDLLRSEDSKAGRGEDSKDGRGQAAGEPVGRDSTRDSGAVVCDGPDSSRRGGPHNHQQPVASCPGAVVAPDQPHKLDGRKALAALAYLDPQHRDARRIMDSTPGLGLLRFDDPFPSSVRSGLEQCLSPSTTPSQAGELLSALSDATVRALSRRGQSRGQNGGAKPLPPSATEEPAGPVAAGASLSARVRSRAEESMNTTPTASLRGGEQSLKGCDPRISSTLEILADAGSPRLTLAGLAKRVGLSPSRFSHLFREHSGLPLRRYLLWLRLQRAVSTMAAGASLTEAAHAAEFSDAAHMSRTFRSMFGISPSELTANRAPPAE